MREMHGPWLRSQRQARGWGVPHMVRKLREAASAAGDTLPDKDCMTVMIHRWEDNRSGISERYRLHYCKALQIPIDDFGRADYEPAAISSPAEMPSAEAVVAAIAPSRGCAVSGSGQPIGEQFAAAARESGDHARDAERRDAGEVTLERIRAVVIRLARESLSGEPVELFGRIRRARDQLHAIAGAQSWPADRHETYLALGCLNSLMAVAAQHAGSPAAAEELALAGLAYASVIRHQPLSARLRLDLAITAFWSGWYSDCLDQAGTGLQHVPAGPVAAQLHLIRARAAARLGDPNKARDALTAADQSGDGTSPSDLAETINQIRFSPALCHHHAGAA